MHERAFHEMMDVLRCGAFEERRIVADAALDIVEFFLIFHSDLTRRFPASLGDDQLAALLLFQLHGALQCVNRYGGLRIVGRLRGDALQP